MMDNSNKKMKRASVSSDQFGGEAKAKLKYHNLLSVFLELQKEFFSRKRKLQDAKDKRQTVLAEVRYLRHRHRQLSKDQAPTMDNIPLHQPKVYIQSDALEGVRVHTTPEAAPERFHQVLLSKFHRKDVERDAKEQVLQKEVRYAKKPKNQIAHDKIVGKRKICWPDQVTLKV